VKLETANRSHHFLFLIHYPVANPSLWHSFITLMPTPTSELTDIFTY